MKLFASVAIVLAATAIRCCHSVDTPRHYLSVDVFDEPIGTPKHLSRRAIDGTRGRKYFDPKTDGFFDEFGYDKGNYGAYKEGSGFSDLRNNVPGEPGVDYPALLKVPRTSFACHGRDHGYYADEETGCQVFHLCDSGFASSFLCPVGSLFSQRLLTCDWWTKVSCAQSHQFYSVQSHAAEPDQDSELSAPVAMVQANHLEHPGYRGRHRYHARVRDHTDRGRGFSTSSTSTARYTPFAVTSTTEPSVRSTTAFANGNDNSVAISSSARPFQTYVASRGRGEKGRRVSTTAAPFGHAFTANQVVVGDITPGNGNSAVDNEDMELKESIGLAKSHAEREFEKEQPVTVQVGEGKVEATTLETDSPGVDEAIATTFPPRNDAKESINEIQSKSEEKLKSFDNDNELATENLTVGVKQKAEGNVDTTTEPFDKSTLLQSSEESTEMVVVVASSENEATPADEAPRKQKARKMSGFLINVPEKKTTEETVPPTEETSPTEPQELPRSLETSTPGDVSSGTTVVEEQTTLFPDEVKKAFDTVEESNAPLEVTVGLTTAGFPASNGLHAGEKQKSPWEKLEIVPPTEAVYRDLVTDQNQFQNGPTSRVRTYQNIRFHYNRDSNQQNQKSVQPQPAVVSTTFRNYQAPSVVSTASQVQTSPASFRNIATDSRARDYQEDGVSSTRHQVVPSTTQASQLRYSSENVQGQKQPLQNNFRTPKTNYFVSTTTVNYGGETAARNHQLEESEKFHHPTTVANQSTRTRSYQAQRNWSENYQARHGNNNPEVLVTSKPKVQQTFDNRPRVFDVHQTTPVYARAPNTARARVVTQKSVEIDNYDYQNYENAEDIDTNLFEDFGAKISGKGRVKFVARVTERPKVRESTDAQAINSQLEGNKAVNFLYTMSQLVDNNRAPRPFEHNEVVQSLNNPANLNHPRPNTRTNDNQNFNNFRQQNNNFDREPPRLDDGQVSDNPYDGEYTIEVDEFAAPKFTKTSRKPAIQQINSNIYWILKDQNRDEEKKFESNKSVSATPAYSVKNTPEINVLSLNQNQQFVQVPQPDFNLYNVENPVSTDENTRQGSYAPQQLSTKQPNNENHQQRNRQYANTQVKLEGNLFEPTVPSSALSVESQDDKFIGSTSTSRTVVETEFIPSISFDFGSYKGRMEYLDAVEKGIVMSDESPSKIKDSNLLASASVEEKSDVEIKSGSRKSEETRADAMNNFKDMPDVMKGTE